MLTDEFSSVSMDHRLQTPMMPARDQRFSEWFDLLSDPIKPIFALAIAFQHKRCVSGPNYIRHPVDNLHSQSQQCVCVQMSLIRLPASCLVLRYSVHVQHPGDSMVDPNTGSWRHPGCEKNCFCFAVVLTYVCC
jgi:hypothetical protein